MFRFMLFCRSGVYRDVSLLDLPAWMNVFAVYSAYEASLPANRRVPTISILSEQLRSFALKTGTRSHQLALSFAFPMHKHSERLNWSGIDSKNCNAVGPFAYSMRHPLGTNDGGDGHRVFAGFYSSTAVESKEEYAASLQCAVKLIPLSQSSSSAAAAASGVGADDRMRTLRALVKARPQHVVTHYDASGDDEQIAIGMEVCWASLADIVSGPKDWFEANGPSSAAGSGGGGSGMPGLESPAGSGMPMLESAGRGGMPRLESAAKQSNGRANNKRDRVIRAVHASHGSNSGVARHIPCALCESPFADGQAAFLLDSVTNEHCNHLYHYECLGRVLLSDPNYRCFCRSLWSTHRAPDATGCQHFQTEKCSAGAVRFACRVHGRLCDAHKAEHDTPKYWKFHRCQPSQPIDTSANGNKRPISVLNDLDSTNSLLRGLVLGLDELAAIDGCGLVHGGISPVCIIVCCVVVSAPVFRFFLTLCFGVSAFCLV